MQINQGGKRGKPSDKMGRNMKATLEKHKHKLQFVFYITQLQTIIKRDGVLHHLYPTVYITLNI